MSVFLRPRQLRRRKALHLEHTSLYDHDHLRGVVLVALLVALTLGGLWRRDANTPSAANDDPPIGTVTPRASSPSTAPVAEVDYLPLVTVTPEYPAAASATGVSGRCTVEFTVTAAGTTRDVRPVDCDPAGVFEAAAVAAARQFKYRPRERDGQTVEVPGVRNEFRFALGQ